MDATATTVPTTLLLAAAFAVQRAVDWSEALIDCFYNLDDPQHATIKRIVISSLSMMFASVFTFGATLDITGRGNIRFPWCLITILSISAGTEGVNSILKAAAYAKDQINPKK
jgi:hypothetical protein